MANRPKHPLAYTLASAFSLVLLGGCGGTEQKGFSDNGTSAAQINAAKETAKTDPDCTSLGNFYWEVGNVDAVLVSNSEGSGAVTRSSVMDISSASNWMFGAYVVEFRGNGGLSLLDKDFLTMSAGYHGFDNQSCTGSINGGDSVQTCLDYGNNGVQTPADDGRFYYNGGHYQKWATQYGGLGTETKSSLATAYRQKLGTDIAVSFSSTQISGGVNTSTTVYAKFLRKLISKALKLGTLLGDDAVCTANGASGCNAVSSPVNEDMHYSYGHWVEDDLSASDGAFSSPGRNGFYPWIDATKRYYGVVARNVAPSPGADELGNGYQSMLCGRKIRKAFLSGIAQ